jgi:hypothetical protein
MDPTSDSSTIHVHTQGDFTNAVKPFCEQGDTPLLPGKESLRQGLESWITSNCGRHFSKPPVKIDGDRYIILMYINVSGNASGNLELLHLGIKVGRGYGGRWQPSPDANQTKPRWRSRIAIRRNIATENADQSQAFGFSLGKRGSHYAGRVYEGL